MLSPSDFNNAVPQFTNGNYASNPINPQYIAEPDAESYNRGTEPLQTLPAQWWNWFLNKFTARFNKVNIYVKNIFNELAQVLSIFNITPDGTEQTPTTSQLKTVFETCYPQYVKTQTTGTAVGCIPTVGTALGTTNNNILVTDSTGKLKPSGITVGTAAGCDATLFARKTEVDALYGNVVGTPLGTASVGTCTTFARSDHVHPMPTCVACAGLVLFSGTGICSMTAQQTPYSYCGSVSDWASYLIFNHGDGSCYYHQMIRMPFTGVPQYQQMVAGQLQGWHNFITDQNIGSQSVACACCASRALGLTMESNLWTAYTGVWYCGEKVAYTNFCNPTDDYILAFYTPYKYPDKFYYCGTGVLLIPPHGLIEPSDGLSVTQTGDGIRLS